jgi:hypothetical protein
VNIELKHLVIQLRVTSVGFLSELRAQTLSFVVAK